MTALARRVAALAALLAALLTAPLAEAQGRRLALVVGNAQYGTLPDLATPGNDASRMAESLRRTGFEVTLLSDVSETMFRAMVDVVAAQARGAEAVVFYYAGQAYQAGGENYLLPVDAKPDAAAPAAGALALGDVLGRLQGSGATTLVFIDASRPNPLGAAAGGDGLAPVNGEPGLFVAFATRPGQVSYDRFDGELSPFATALLNYIETPGLGISDVMVRVRRDVEAATVGRQVPWDQSSLRAPFAFAPGDGPAAGATAQAAADPAVRGAPAPLVRTSLRLVTSAPAPEPAAVVTEPVPVVTGPAPEPQPAAVPVVAEPTPEPTPSPPPAPLLVARRLAPLDSPAPPAAAPIAAPRAAVPAAAVVAPAPPSGAPAGQVHADAPILSVVPAAGRTRIMGMSPGAEPAAFTPAGAPTGDPAGTEVLPPGVAAAALPAAPDDLPRAVQEELARVGCYGLGVDGDWGAGSRTALKHYYEAKGQTPAEPLDPTEDLWRVLTAEPAGICKQAVAAAPKPKVEKRAAPATTAAPRPAAAEPERARAPTKPRAPAPAPAPTAPAKKKQTCKFLVVAIVCS